MTEGELATLSRGMAKPIVEHLQLALAPIVVRLELIEDRIARLETAVADRPVAQ